MSAGACSCLSPRPCLLATFLWVGDALACLGFSHLWEAAGASPRLLWCAREIRSGARGTSLLVRSVLVPTLCFGARRVSLWFGARSICLAHGRSFCRAARGERNVDVRPCHALQLLFFVAALARFAPCCAAFEFLLRLFLRSFERSRSFARSRVVKGLVLSARVVLVRVACFSRVPQEWF